MSCYLLECYHVHTGNHRRNMAIMTRSSSTKPHMISTKALHGLHYQIYLRPNSRSTIKLLNIKYLEHPVDFWWPPKCSSSPSPHLTSLEQWRNPLTFHFTGCSPGILIMIYQNPYVTGKYSPLKTINNQGCFIAHLTKNTQLVPHVENILHAGKDRTLLVDVLATPQSFWVWLL